MLNRILIAHDGSDGAQAAFDTAVELAARLKATLHMVSVEEDLPQYAQTVGDVAEQKEDQDSYFGQLAAQCRRRAALSEVDLRSSIIAGHEVKAIVDFVREGSYDLLVIGYTGHSRIFDHLWGGTSQNLTRAVQCSVLVVK
jgi:nucleotide-binding universal stress UspA family protein